MGLFIEGGRLDGIEADAIVNGTNTDKRWLFRRGRITSMRSNGACCKSFWLTDCGWTSEEQRVQFCADGKTAEIMQMKSLLREGEAKIVPADGLPMFRYQIFTAVPDWHRGKRNEKLLLQKCYENSLRAAVETGCRSILFPQLGTGEFAFPPKVSIGIAIHTLQDFARENNIDIHFIPSDDLSLVDCLRTNLGNMISDLARYFNAHYKEPVYRSSKKVIRRTKDIDDKKGTIPTQTGSAVQKERTKLPSEETKRLSANYLYDENARGLTNKMKSLLPQKKPGELFREYLYSLMERIGKKKTDVYKGANLDRRLFSKIQNDTAHVPGKRTVLALAISLRLSLEDARAFLAQAGFAFSPSEKTDIIIEYFVTKGQYDIQLINEVLYSLGERTLGSMSWEDHKRKY